MHHELLQIIAADYTDNRVRGAEKARLARQAAKSESSGRARSRRRFTRRLGIGIPLVILH